MATIGRLAVSIVADISGLKKNLKQAEREVDRYTKRVNQKARTQGRGGSFGQALGMPPGSYARRVVPEKTPPSGLEALLGGAKGKVGLAAGITLLTGAVVKLADHMNTMRSEGDEFRRNLERSRNIVGSYNEEMSRLEAQQTRVREQLSETWEPVTKFFKGFKTGAEEYLAGGLRTGAGGARLQYEPMRHERPFGLARATTAAGFRAIQEAQMQHYVRAQRLRRLQAYEDRPSEHTDVGRRLEQVDSSLVRRYVMGTLQGGPNAPEAELTPQAAGQISGEAGMRVLTEGPAITHLKTIVLLLQRLVDANAEGAFATRKSPLSADLFGP